MTKLDKTVTLLSGSRCCFISVLSVVYYSFITALYVDGYESR